MLYHNFGDRVGLCSKKSIILLAILMFGLSCQVSAKLNASAFGTPIISNRGNVMVLYFWIGEDAHDFIPAFVFDSDGKFLGAIRFKLPFDNVSVLDITMIDKNSVLWGECTTSIRTEQKDAYGRFEFKRYIVKYSTDGKIINSQPIADVPYYITSAGVLYMVDSGKDKASPIVVQRIEQNGNKTALFSLKKEEKYQSYSAGVALPQKLAVNSKEEIYLLVSILDKGYVYHYSRKGELLNKWIVTPDPITSVSYVKNIKIGPNDSIYVGWSSCEVSLAKSNLGGIFIYSQDGKFINHVHKDIQYLQQFAVAGNGDIYLHDLGYEIKKYSSSGELVTAWNAMPPYHGENWQEKQRRENIAKTANKNSSLEMLCAALPYSNEENQKNIKEWILQKPSNQFVELVPAALKYPPCAVEDFIKKYKEEIKKDAKSLIESGNEAVHELLLDIYVDTYKPYDDPFLAKLINRYVREGKWIGLIDHFPLEEDTVIYYLEELKTASVNDLPFNIIYTIKGQIYKPVLFNQIIQIIKDEKSPLRNKIIKIVNEIKQDDLEFTLNNPDTDLKPFIEAFRKLSEDANLEIKKIALDVLARFNALSDLIAYLNFAPQDDKGRAAMACSVISHIGHGSSIDKEQRKTFITQINNIQNKNEMEAVSLCLYETINKTGNTDLLLSMVKEDISDTVKYYWLDLLSASKYKEIISVYNSALQSSISKDTKMRICRNLNSFENEECKKFHESISESRKKSDDEICLEKAIQDYSKEAQIAIDFMYSEATEDVRKHISEKLCKARGAEKLMGLLQELTLDESIGFYASLALVRMGNRAGLPGALEGLKKVGSYSNYGIFYDKDIFKPFLPGIIDELKPLLDYPDLPTAELAAEMLMSMSDDEAMRKKIKEAVIEQLKKYDILNLNLVCSFVPEDLQFFKQIVNVGIELINNGEHIYIEKCGNPEALIALINEKNSKSSSDSERKFYQKILEEIK